MNKRILELIRKNKTFLLSTHVHPDPDAICSVLALGIFLRQKGKKVHMLFEDSLIKRFQFFPTAKLARKVQLRRKYNYDVAMILDCGDFDRIGSVAKVIDRKKPLVNIDHHITNTKFGTINLVKNASSTAEVLYDVLAAGRVRWTKALALNIYAGIMTDTGSFRYENTTSKTHAIVSKLLKYNIPVAGLYGRMYERIPLRDLTAFSKVINGFQSHYNGRVVSVVLKRKTQESFSENFDLRDAIFKYLRAIDGVEVIFIVTEVGRKNSRVNFRSGKRVDVAKIAASLDGGGHQRASGCQLDKSVTEAKAIVLKEDQKGVVVEGILVVNKPDGYTSHDVVAVVRRSLNFKKVGHAGTLDPMATGVLVCLVGRATKLSNQFVAFDKTYHATVVLGKVTDSADTQGKVLKEQPYDHITRDAVEEVIKTFLGETDQIPPMVSAVKVKGKKLYELARKGITIERKPRRIRIDEIRIEDFQLPEIKIYVACSKGTYIRQLAHDIGEKLGCGACISQIQRVAVGPYRLDQAVSLEEIHESHLRNFKHPQKI